MKELGFDSFVNRYGETVYRFVLELKEEHFLEISTNESDAATDLYYTDIPRYMCPRNTVFLTLPCKWGNNHGVFFKHRSTAYGYPISDTSEKIKSVMLKWAKQYVRKEYPELCV